MKTMAAIELIADTETRAGLVYYLKLEEVQLA